MFRHHFGAVVLFAATLGGCGGDQNDADTSGSTTAASSGSTEAQKVGETGGLKVPESVRYDADLDAYFITNINGNPSQRDNNGYIARVHPDSLNAVTVIAEGGRRGLYLNAPKGLAIQGDTLFVTDIYMLRKFNKRTGEYIGAVNLRDYGATFLNDIAIGPDGVYITDTGIEFDEQGNMTHPGENRVYKVNGLRVTTALRGDSLMNPNGITWDAANARFILAPFGGPNLQAWNPGTEQTTTLVAGPGGYDGVEVLRNGNILVSSWTDSTVHVVHGGSHMMPLVRNVAAPADIGVDTKRNIVAIPRFNDGKVEYYKIP
jgi:sugar lactone lactonase YvrE